MNGWLIIAGLLAIMLGIALYMDNPNARSRSYSNSQFGEFRGTPANVLMFMGFAMMGLGAVI